MSLNYFQGLEATGTASYTSASGTASSTVKFDYYFNFQNAGGEMSSTTTFNGASAGKFESYSISMYKPCKLYSTTITTPPSSRRSLEAKDPQEFMENLGLPMHKNRRLVNGTDDGTDDAGND